MLALIDSRDPKQYIQRIKTRDPELKKGWVQIVRTLEVNTKGGNQKMICANTEGIFRIIQSIPSPKAEPFKRWLAKVGYERVQEIEDPELAQKRMKELYEKKGYSKSWIDKRLRGIAVRQDLTDEWQARGAKENIEYAILTNEIMQGAFGMKVDEYKKLVGQRKVSQSVTQIMAEQLSREKRKKAPNIAKKIGQKIDKASVNISTQELINSYKKYRKH